MVRTALLRFVTLSGSTAVRARLSSALRLLQAASLLRRLTHVILWKHLDGVGRSKISLSLSWRGERGTATFHSTATLHHAAVSCIGQVQQS